MNFSYCPKCGAKLSERPIGDEGSVPFCTECSRPWFGFSYPCVICLLHDGSENYALIQQSYGEKKYVCVAGFIHDGENAEQTAAREILEETGLKTQSIQYVGSWYYPKNDNLMLGFACQVERSEFHLSRNEVSTAEWFDAEIALEKLKNASIAKQLLIEWINKKY